MSASPMPTRCAIYTRKSSDEGLDQEFNSLEAQREASEAYVKSQTHEGWRLISTRYDDGGFSGGRIDRPALQHLLADIAAGQVDVVVVYKIDRLTRSLADFARIVELFDKHEVSFVSVTQSFNTTSSMGRLTLNVLLSFAQFEREVTGERIRDKIAASKAKGMWMGGFLPLGYDLPKENSRRLVVNEVEAETVRLIFREYLRLRSVYALARRLERNGVVSKCWQTASGKLLGGVPFNRGALYRMLRNDTYLGFIRHKEKVHAGRHEPILDKALFDRVKRELDAKCTRHALRQSTRGKAPLVGRIFDARGEPMSPTSSRGKSGRNYRYYVSASLQKGEPTCEGDHHEGEFIRRISADVLETELPAIISRLLPKWAGNAWALPMRVEVHAHAVHLVLPKSACVGLECRLSSNDRIEKYLNDRTSLRLICSNVIRCRRGRTQINSSAVRRMTRDPVLIAALQRAHAMLELDARNLPVCGKSPETQYGRRLIALAFLAPDLQQSIVDGTQPAGLALQHLIARPLPSDWAAQRKLFEHI